MGVVSNIVNKIFIIGLMMVIFILMSLQSTCILIIAEASSLDAAAATAEDYYYFKVQKVSGEDENEQKEAMIVEKFRALLGLKSFKSAKVPILHGHDSEDFSPAPSPAQSFEDVSPAPAPAPARLQPFHSHAHHPPPPPPRFNSTPHHKMQKDSNNKGRVIRRVLVPVLVSTGAVFFLLGALGLIWVCCSNNKHHKNSSRKMSVLFGKKSRIKGGKSKYASSQRSTTSSSKVNLNPSIDDLFYLNSLGMDLEEQQSSCLISSLDENVTTCSKKQEVIKSSESDNASSSAATREITSVHEDDDAADSVKNESDGSSGDKIIPCEIDIDCHSSDDDDDSFHSFNDSPASNFRLSNASAANSLSDPQEKNLSPDLAKVPQSPLHSSTNSQYETQQPLSNHQEENLKVPSSPDCHNNKNCEASPSLSPPTPPPPPPLPPFVSYYSHSKSLSRHAKLVSKASSSSTLRNLSSPRDSDSSSESNQTPLSVLLSPLETLKALPTLPGIIPPPPCPPPLLKQNKNPLKGPSLLPEDSPLGKDGAPLPKLKPLHWDKVRAQPDRSMVWDKLRSSSFELDEEMIESLFGYNLQNSLKNDETKSKTPSPSKHVLEPKRLQNITILSKALNVTAEQVCDALMKGEGLSLQQLEALVKMVPTKEEETKLSSYKGDINELGSAERFVKAMLTIPLAFQRAEVMLYRETFEDEVVHLRNSFSMLEEACKELRSSRLFLKLLEAVLKTGNRMNVGTIRGGAKAFKLDALLKLADVKGTDGKTTLLHFVVQEIIRSEGMRVSDSIMGKIINQRNNKTKTDEEKEEDYRRMGLELVSGLSTEIYNVKKTATIDLDVLASSVSNLTDGMAKLKHILLDSSSIDDDDKSGNNFVHSMSAFIKYAERNIKKLQEDESRVLLHVREITEYFHGDVSKEEANPLRIFVIVRDFLGMLDHVCKELRSLKLPSSPNPLAPFR